MRDIDHIVYDGDTADFEPTLKDSGAAIDLKDCAVWFDIKDALTGVHLARRPWKILSPKTAGKSRLFLRGFETDWLGAGRDLLVSPVAMIPTQDADPTLRAANLLVNGSFDDATGTSPTRLADSWSIAGSGSGSVVFDNFESDTKPASIFGPVQSVVRAAAGDSAYLVQTVSQNFAPGEHATLGIWVRGNELGGAAANNNNALRLIFGNAADNALTQLPIVDYDWRFVTVTRKITVTQTTVQVRLVTYGDTGQWRFDEGAFFEGRYRKLYLDRFRIVVKTTRRLPKTSNQIAGYGGFERDSNADGIADAWAHGATWSGITPTLDKDPANVHLGERSQKLVLSASAAGSYLVHTERGKHVAGEQWEFSVQAKTDGAMSAAATVELQTQPFMAGGAYQEATPVSIGPDLTSFTKVATTITLTEDTEALECRIGLGGITGTLWIDDAQLKRM